MISLDDIQSESGRYVMFLSLRHKETSALCKFYRITRLKVCCLGKKKEKNIYACGVRSLDTDQRCEIVDIIN